MLSQGSATFILYHKNVTHFRKFHWFLPFAHLKPISFYVFHRINLFQCIFHAVYIHCKKYFEDLLSQHSFFCQINFIKMYLVEITYYFEVIIYSDG